MAVINSWNFLKIISRKNVIKIWKYETENARNEVSRPRFSMSTQFISTNFFGTRYFPEKKHHSLWLVFYCVLSTATFLGIFVLDFSSIDRNNENLSTMTCTIKDMYKICYPYVVHTWKLGDVIWHSFHAVIWCKNALLWFVWFTKYSYFNV